MSRTHALRIEQARWRFIKEYLTRSMQLPEKKPDIQETLESVRETQFIKRTPIIEKDIAPLSK